MVWLAVIVLAAVTIGRALASRLIARAGRGSTPGPVVATVVAAFLGCAAASQAAGLEASFGAFVGGLVVGTAAETDLRWLAPLRTVVASVLAPLFFATAALRVDLGVLGHPAILASAIVAIGIAAVGKFARGLPRRDGREAGPLGVAGPGRRDERPRRHPDHRGHGGPADRGAEHRLLHHRGAGRGDHLAHGAADPAPGSGAGSAALRRRRNAGSGSPLRGDLLAGCARSPVPPPAGSEASTGRGRSSPAAGSAIPGCRRRRCPGCRRGRGGGPHDGSPGPTSGPPVHRWSAGTCSSPSTPGSRGGGTR